MLKDLVSNGHTDTSNRSRTMSINCARWRGSRGLEEHPVRLQSGSWLACAWGWLSNTQLERMHDVTICMFYSGFGALLRWKGSSVHLFLVRRMLTVINPTCIISRLKGLKPVLLCYSSLLISTISVNHFYYTIRLCWTNLRLRNIVNGHLTTIEKQYKSSNVSLFKLCSQLMWSKYFLF